MFLPRIYVKYIAWTILRSELPEDLVHATKIGTQCRAPKYDQRPPYTRTVHCQVKVSQPTLNRKGHTKRSVRPWRGNLSQLSCGGNITSSAENRLPKLLWQRRYLHILTLLSYGEVCKSTPRPGPSNPALPSTWTQGPKQSRINPRKKTTRSADQNRQTSSDLGLFTCSLPESGPPVPNDACNEHFVSQRYGDMNRALTLIHTSS
jgi:hypothetical protein